jgi:hypothetical protein
LIDKKPNVETIETIQSTTFRQLFSKTPMLETMETIQLTTTLRILRRSFALKCSQRGKLGGSHHPHHCFFKKKKE